MTSDRQGPGHPNVTIHLLRGTKRIAVTRGLELLAKAGLGTTIGVHARKDGKVAALAVHGPYIVADKLPEQFLAFCEARSVTPVNPVSPWQKSVYTGQGRENDIFEITVDQYRAFAAGYCVDVEIGPVHGVAVAAANDESPDADSNARRESNSDGAHAADARPLASVRPWRVTKPERPDALAWALYGLLDSQQRMGLPPLKAREVMDLWRVQLPPDILTVTVDSVEFLDGKGDPKGVMVKPLAERIKRMTS